MACSFFSLFFLLRNHITFSQVEFARVISNELFKFDVNKKDHENQISLTIACEKGHEAIVEYLIKNGADPNQIAENTPLIIACSKNNKNLVQCLIEHGADVNKNNRHFDNYSSECTNSNSIYLKDNYTTPLIVACQNNNENIITYLVDYRADVNQINSNEEIPLLIACEQENEKLVKYLIEHDEDVNLETEYADVKTTALTIACSYGNEIIVKELVKHNANVNRIALYGYTPLTIACANNYEKIIKYLVDHGADINKLDESGEAPLHFLSFNDNIPLANYLIDHGANINLRSSHKKHQTLLTIACSKNYNEMVYLLL